MGSGGNEVREMGRDLLIAWGPCESFVFYLKWEKVCEKSNVFKHAVKRS